MIGIYLMGFVILVAGVGALGTSVAYAVKPSESRLALMRPLSLASMCAAVCSTSVGIATALKGAADANVSADAVRMMVAGLSESCVPLFVAFAFLAVAWTLVAVGIRRQA